MPLFSDNVFSVFRELQDHCGFLPAYAFSGKDSATLVKRLSNDVFLYLFVRDGRPNNADLSICIWIAPLHEPGDGLDRLYIGFKLLISSTYEVTDEFFQFSQRRILNLMRHIECLGDAVREELTTSVFETQRNKVYKLERQAFDALQQSKCAQTSVDSFTAMVRGKRASYRALEKVATEIARQLLEEGHLNDDVVGFFGTDVASLGNSLLGLLYVHALTA